jgi:hypothetical protein
MSLANASSRPTYAVRARGRLLSIRDALVQHRAYFDAGVAR